MLAVRAALGLSLSALALGALSVGLSAPRTGAAQTMPGARAWAEAVVALTTPRWEGPTVARPPEAPRPELPSKLESIRLPVAVHFDETIALARVEAVLAALERAYDALTAAGWPHPPADGGRGGTDGFDLYLATERPGSAVAARADASIPWALLDAVTTFAVVDPGMARGTLETCVASAYAEAVLLAMDPAEAESVRRATAEWLAWTETGQPGCHGAILDHQRDPHRSYLDHEGDHGGALLLALLSARSDEGTGIRIRDAWHLARQASGPAAPRLRGSPDLFMALDHALSLEGRNLLDDVRWAAAERYFIGRNGARSQRSTLLRELPAGVSVPLFAELAFDALPRRTRAHDPPLETFGSAYARIDVQGAPADATLKVWLRGEYGVRWSLQALTLDAKGREIARLEAPIRSEPRSYLPVELSPEVASVVIVVTNLSSRLPDADLPDENERSFELVVGR